MKRKLSLIIVSLMLFNFTAGLSAKTFQNETDINHFDFDEFAIEQTQNIFTSTISETTNSKSSSNQMTDNSFLLYATDFNAQNFLNNKFEKDKIILFAYPDEKKYCLDRFRESSQSCLFFTGLTQYRVRLNAYIAKVVPSDVYVAVNKNIKD